MLRLAPSAISFPVVRSSALEDLGLEAIQELLRLLGIAQVIGGEVEPQRLRRLLPWGFFSSLVALTGLDPEVASSSGFGCC